MKNIIFLFLFLLPAVAFAQSDRKVDSHGNLLYQYQRTASEPCDTCTELKVTFLFVNGNRPAAISFRQETLDTKVRWIDISGGTAGHEEVVDFVTANLEPNQTITWSYAVSAKIGKVSAPEQAALLIMDEKYGVEKVWLK